MTKYTKAEQAASLENLRKWIKPGSTVYTLLESRAKSGLSRWIRIVLIEGDRDGQVHMTHPNHAVAVVLGLHQDRKHEGMQIHGGGMDMGFEIVYRLGQTLWPAGTIVPGKTDPLCAGRYALNHRWI